VSLLVRGARVVDAFEQSEGDILVEGDRIARVGRLPDARADVVIDAEGMAAIPGLVNAHTHAAMVLLRGYADDLELHEWLNTRIWPTERHLEPAHVYHGVRLAALEMLKSGTTTFNDMYFFAEEGARASAEVGIRATISAVFFNVFAKKSLEDARAEIEGALTRTGTYRDVRPAVGPHAPYTVDLEGLDACARIAEAHDTVLHFHLAETEQEVGDYRRQHGRGVVEALDEIGFIGPRLVAAHAIWLTPQEMRLLGQRRAHVAHCPAANLKLVAGRAADGRPRAFDYPAMKAAGVNVALGTDGAASSNHLDMFEAMRLAALLQKHASGDPTCLPAREAFALATVNGATALGVDAGRIAPGRLADIVLLDLAHPRLVPGHDLIADLVYSAPSAAVHTVIVGGRIVVRGGRVEGEERIVADARAAARDLVSRTA
jgi:5-methylthioadenosine/S-adenosylhomocysteine deaminase